MPESATVPDEILDLRQIVKERPDISTSEFANHVARDQAIRWRRGERVLVESYFDLHPPLSDPSNLLDLVYSELMLRESLGERPKVEEYCFRFPQLTNAIQSLFQLHQALTQAPDIRPSVRLQSKLKHGPANGVHATSAKPLIELPGFEVFEEIGRGGMGIVYKARQLELGRIVAVKTLRSDDVDPDWEIRLRREAEAIAQVQHPNIVQVFDVGSFHDHTYLVLEYVPGGTLADRLRAGPMPAREAAELVRTVAMAVHEAHEHQIIHRDLKPGNILLQAPESRPPVTPDASSNSGNSSSLRRAMHPLPKVTDFGLSKRMDQNDLSRTGELIGTPNYMAPEQASGSKQIGPATDVYSLGAILYECLTGRPPFIGDSPVSVLMQVTKDEPVTPSRLRPGVPRDLESVCLKCLEKTPGKRYTSAQDLADDLERFMLGQTTVARPLSRVGKALKLVRRHPLPFGLTALLIASLIGGFLGMTWQWRKAVTARMDEAEQRHAAERNLYYARLAQSESLWENGETVRARGLLADCRPELGQNDPRGWEWHHLNRMFRLETRIVPLQYWVNGIAFQKVDPDQTMSLAFAEGKPKYNSMQQPKPGDGQAGWITTPRNGPFSIRLGPELSAGATAFAQHRVSQHFAWGTNAGNVILTGSDGRAKTSTRLPGSVTSLVFHPDGMNLYASTISNERTDIFVIDVANGKITNQQRHKAGRPGALAIDPQGEWLAVGGYWARIVLFRLSDLSQVDEFQGLPDSVTALEPSPDGQTLFIGTSIGTIVAWKMSQRAEAYRWSAHTGPVYAIATTRDGKVLASGGSDNTVRLWNSATGQASTVFRGHDATIRCASFSDDGRWLASGGQDGTVRVWDATLDTRGRRIPFHHRLNDIAIVDSPLGYQVRAVALNGRVQTFLLDDGHCTSQFSAAMTIRAMYPVRYATFLGRDRHLVGIDAADSKTIRCWNGDNGQVIRSWPAAHGPVTTMATDFHARFLTWAATVDGGSDIYWWDENSKRSGGPIRLRVPLIRALAMSSDGKWIAAQAVPEPNHVESTCWVIDPTGRQTPVQLTKGQAVSGAIAFRPDSRELAMAVDGTMLAFDVDSWKPKYQFPCPRATTCLAYSPDGQRLAVVGYSGNVTLADPSNGKRVFRLKGLAPGRPDDMACDARVAFSADGRWLVSTNWDGSINVWDGMPLAE